MENPSFLGSVKVQRGRMTTLWLISSGECSRLILGFTCFASNICMLVSPTKKLCCGGEVCEIVSKRNFLKDWRLHVPWSWYGHMNRSDLPNPRLLDPQVAPPITAPRIELRDGRHIAYKEHGKPRDLAKYKIIFLHGFQGCRHDAVLADHLSKELIDNLGIYVVSFDRPGYGESDPDQRRTPKSIALDIEELADKLELGSLFYVIGLSMGGQAVWGCLKYIPHRLAGAALLAPVVNYWWPSFPTDLSMEAYYRQLPQDQWAVWVAHYAPWLTYWWNTQKWFPPSSAIVRNPMAFSVPDRDVLSSSTPKTDHIALVRQQGDSVSLHREFMIGFGTWQFDPMEIENPFPDGEGSVHLWQGDDDSVVPVTLQRYIARQLPWIKYHELAETGHLFPMVEGMSDKIVKALLLHEGES